MCATHHALRIIPHGTLGTTSSAFVCSCRHYCIPQSAVGEFQPLSYFLPLKTVSVHRVHTQTRMRCVAPFEYTFKLWRGNYKNSPLPTIGSAVRESRPTFLYRRMYVRIYPKMIFGAFFFFFLLKKVNIPTFAH